MPFLAITTKRVCSNDMLLTVAADAVAGITSAAATRETAVSIRTIGLFMTVVVGWIRALVHA